MTIHLLDTPLPTQLTNLSTWSDQVGWKLPKQWFDDVDTTPSDLAGGLVIDVMYPILPAKGRGGAKLTSVQRTFDELWSVGASRQPGSWRWPSLKSDTKHLRLLDGIDYEPGLHRATIDLGAHKGKAPVDVRGADSAGAEILAAAAHFPEWVRAMNGGDIPYVWLPAYQASVDGLDPWRAVPYLDWSQSGREAELNARWVGLATRNWACPVRRES